MADEKRIYLCLAHNNFGSSFKFQVSGFKFQDSSFKFQDSSFKFQVSSFMIIDKKLLDDLSAQAKASPRPRQAYDLRNTLEDNSQRMLNRRTKQAQRQSSL